MADPMIEVCTVTPVFDADDAPTPVRLHHLRIEQPGQWHPARFRLGPFGLSAFGLHPLAVMRNKRGEILLEPPFRTPVF